MIALIEGCGTNLMSLQVALERLGQAAVVTKELSIIRSASHIILPGVGHVDATLRTLQSSGLDTLIKTLTQPVLGICLGMQLLFDFSEEAGMPCLGIFPEATRLFPKKPGFTVPHMGWNRLYLNNPQHTLFNNIAENSYVYFTHSYYAPLNAGTLASTDHDFHFSAIVQHNNFFGMQFHPEKSGSVGKQLLRNFLEAL